MSRKISIFESLMEFKLQNVFVNEKFSSLNQQNLTAEITKNICIWMDLNKVKITGTVWTMSTNKMWRDFFFLSLYSFILLSHGLDVYFCWSYVLCQLTKLCLHVLIVIFLSAKTYLGRNYNFSLYSNNK